MKDFTAYRLEWQWFALVKHPPKATDNETFITTVLSSDRTKFQKRQDEKLILQKETQKFVQPLSNIFCLKNIR